MKQKQILILLLILTGFMNPFINAQTLDTAVEVKKTGCVMGDCKNGFGIWIPNGDENYQYEGHYKSGNRDGFGKAIYTFGDTYEGEWLDNKQNGYGVYTWKNGDVYKGYWVNGYEEGEGTVYHADGRIVKGIFDEYTKHKNVGQVKTTECISGDCQNGYGVYTDEKYHYEGNFKDGKRDGQGKNTDAWGNVYDGNWSNDKYSGFGTFKWKSGEKYEGNWENGKQEGQATYYKPDGSIEYQGNYHRGDRVDINSPDYPFWVTLNKIMNDFANDFNNLEGEVATDRAFAKLSTVNLPGCKQGYVIKGLGREHKSWSTQVICDGTEEDALNKFHEYGDKIKIAYKDCGRFMEDKLDSPKTEENKNAMYQRWWLPSFVFPDFDKSFKYIMINITVKQGLLDDIWVVNLFINYNEDME